MTTMHDRPRAGAAGPPRPYGPTWLLVAAVVAIVAGVVVTVAVLAGNDGTPTGTSTIRGSGHAVTAVRPLPPFAGVELSGSTDVTVRVGTPQSVTVRADDNLVGHVRTIVRSGTLVVETTGSFSTRVPMRVTVVVPELTGVALSGSGRVDAEGVDAASFTADLSGSGTVRVAGRTDHLSASLPGSGRLDLRDLAARSVEAQLSGSGEIEVRATEALDAHVSGSGMVLYTGDPSQVTKDVTGSGTIQPD